MVAGYTLINFVADNPVEMAKSVSPDIDTWMVWPENHPHKAHYLWLYFKTYLKKTDDGKFIIKPID